MMKDWRQVELSSVNRALCEFAEKLTVSPASMAKEDIQKLRSLGLSDAAVHDAVQTISYFNYINRVADALGVDPEEWLEL